MDEKSPHLTLQLLKHLVPFILKELVADIKSGHGYLNLPTALFPFLSSVIWADWYQDEKRFKALLPTLFLRHLPKEDQEQLLSASQEEKRALVDLFKADAITEFETSSAPFDLATIIGYPTLEEVVAHWEKLSEGEREEATINSKLIACFFMTTVCTFLALMSFGQTMCDLVSKAKAGDDDAFCKAVQVDRTVLFGIPYFQQRLIWAQAGCEPTFLNDLANAIKAPPLSKKLRYPVLMIVFYVLDDDKLLDMPLDQLFDLCQELGLYGREFGIEDTETLRKRRQYYYRMTGRQIRF